MIEVLALIVAVEALLIGWLIRAVRRSAAAHLAACDLFAGWSGTVAAQTRTNEATLGAVQAINRAIAGHRDSLVRLHAQDQQFFEVLVACGLIDTSAPQMTVN